MLKIDYPEEWNDLPKHERKKKLKELWREHGRKSGLVKKVRNWGVLIVVLVVGVVGFTIQPEREIETVSLDGKVEEFTIEGKNHVPPGTKVEYRTNPPTSGDHYANPAGWGVYGKEVVDENAVHSLEHGGIWIAYKDIDDTEKKILEEIGKANSQSVIVSPRSANDVKIAIVSWGKLMKLEEVDKAVIQKYIGTYKNQSPERLAR